MISNDQGTRGDCGVDEMPTITMPCEIAANIIPSIRAAIAIALVEELGLSRYEAAKFLGMTPAAVTNYLEGKRGNVYLKKILRDERLYRIVREVASLIAKHRGLKGDALRAYKEAVCKICCCLNELGCPRRFGELKGAEGQLAESFNAL